MQAILLTLAALPLLAQSPAIKIDVQLVTVPCTVTDRNGALVPHLTADDFVLLEDGQPRQIKHVWQEADLPLTIGIIVDVSGSQFRYIERHRQEVAQFLSQVIGKGDRAFIVTVGREARLVTDLTGSLDELRAGMDSIGRHGSAPIIGDPCRGTHHHRGCGGTALWNGVWAASRLKMKNAEGRKALVILSDGLDTGSRHSLSDAIEAAQGADTVAYAVRSLDKMIFAMAPLAAPIIMTKAHGMPRLADETGGKLFEAPKGSPSEIFARIEEELRMQYVLGFSPTAVNDGKYHHIKVQAKQPDRQVRARKGYYAGA